MTWDALLGQIAKGDYYDPDTWEVFLRAGDRMDQAAVDRLDLLGLASTEAELQGLLPGEQSAPQWIGWGRHKSAVAQVVLRAGSGELRVNGQALSEYFSKSPGKAKEFLQRLLTLEAVKQILEEMEVIIQVQGSGPESSRQARAVAHALARALVNYDSHLKTQLERHGFRGVQVRPSDRF